jgi:hypothetical protein
MIKMEIELQVVNNYNHLEKPTAEGTCAFNRGNVEDIINGYLKGHNLQDPEGPSCVVKIQQGYDKKKRKKVLLQEFDEGTKTVKQWLHCEFFIKDIPDPDFATSEQIESGLTDLSVEEFLEDLLSEEDLGATEGTIKVYQRVLITNL